MSMASEELSDRIRALLPPLANVREQKMFGGRAFMLDGNMLVCPTKEGSLIVRVGKMGWRMRTPNRVPRSWIWVDAA